MTGPGLSSLTATATAMSRGESRRIAESDAAMSNARFQSGMRNNRYFVPGACDGFADERIVGHELQCAEEICAR